MSTSKHPLLNMSVADVRKALGTMRSAWENHTIDKPINPSQRIIHDMSLSEFAFCFVYSHHEKRHHKTDGRKK